MLEIYTTNLTKDQLLMFVNNAKESEYFKKNDSADFMTFNSKVLPGLSDFEISNLYRKVSLDHIFQPDEIDSEFFSELLELSKDAEIVYCRFDISDSGVDFDFEEDTDVKISLGFKRGYYAGIDIGGISKAYQDLSYRRSLFMDFLDFCNLTDKLDIIFEDGKLVLKSIHECSDFDEKVWLSAGDLYQRNFKIMQLKYFDKEDIVKLYSNLKEKYQNKILKSELSIVVSDDKYNNLMKADSVSRISPWQVRICAKSRYGLESLGEAIDNNKGLFLNPFSLKTRKTGEVDVYVCKNEKGELFMNFQVEPKRSMDKQEKAIHEMIIELAGGKDIIDKTPL